MNRVFVVNQPMKAAYSLQQGTSGLVPAVDLSPAREYGELVQLLPPGELDLDLETVVGLLREGLKQFKPTDYLLLVGDPRAIAWAAVIAAERTGGKLRVLQWLRSRRRYAENYAELYAA